VKTSGYHVAIVDGAEPDDPEPMLVTDDNDEPIRFDTFTAADEWMFANYPEWIINNHGNGQHWKQYGFRAVPVPVEEQAQ
jgi:hypothetical protein